MTRCLTIVGNGEQAAGAAADEQGEEDGRGRAVPEGDNNHSDPTVHVMHSISESSFENPK